MPVPLWLIFAFAAVLLIAMASLAVVARQLLNPRRGVIDPDWLASFSPSRYRPMQRLLAFEEIEFLRSTAGYTPELEKTFRAGRKQMFRRYLNLIAADFEKLHATARFLALHAPVDRPDLAKVLVREQVSFRRTMIAAHLRWLTYGYGHNSIDVRALVDALESMNAHVRTLATVPSA